MKTERFAAASLHHAVRRARMIGLAIIVVSLALTRLATAQGVCQCNIGCYASPGACVLDATGCDPGYAALCATHPTGGCAHTGEVSCAGSCTCMRMLPVDAGSFDATVPVIDASIDASIVDATTVDVAIGTAPIDPRSQTLQTPTGYDVRRQISSIWGDARTEDVFCATGLLVGGVCYAERCQSDVEAGFSCAMSGYSCRPVRGVPLCIPVCASRVCALDTYCDPRAGCLPFPDGGLRCADLQCPPGEICDPNAGCVTDRCAGVVCQRGLQCLSGECIPIPVSAAGDGGFAGDGSMHPRVIPMGGCGCRSAPGRSSSDGTAGLVVAIFVSLVTALLRPRRRATCQRPVESRQR